MGGLSQIGVEGAAGNVLAQSKGELGLAVNKFWVFEELSQDEGFSSIIGHLYADHVLAGILDYTPTQISDLAGDGAFGDAPDAADGVTDGL